MHVQNWEKYLPVIRILIKRSNVSEQVFSLNSTDFPPPSATKKSSSRFSLHLRNGSVVNNIGTSVMAKDLASVLTEDDVIKSLLSNGDYLFHLNTKNQLSIRSVADSSVS